MAYCPNCKRNYPDGTRFCGNCGAPLVNTNPPVQNPMAQPSQNRTSQPVQNRASQPSQSQTSQQAPGQPSQPMLDWTTQPVDMQTPSGSNPKGVRIDTSRRTFKALLCIPVALVIIIGVIIFFKIDLKNMNGYVQFMAVKLSDFARIKKNLPITLGKIAVYGLALMIILSAYMMPARLSKTILKTVTITDRVIVFFAGYFIIAFIIWFIQTFFYENALGKSFRIIARGGGAAIKEIILLIILLALMLVAILICIRASLYIIIVVTENLKVNGPVLGVIGAAYELLSSIFVTALVLCAVTFGLAIIMLPVVLGAASMSGKRVIRDEDGNLYTVS